MGDFRPLIETIRYMLSPEADLKHLFRIWEGHISEWKNDLRFLGDIEQRHHTLYKPGSKPHGDVDKELLNSLWDWYSLSRLNDMLLLAFQPEKPKKAQVGYNFKLSLKDYDELMYMLKLSPVRHKAFHPFYHEIIEVEQSADPDEPITLVSEFYPSYMQDSMMFSRAGVKVRGGVNHIVKEVAEESVLYFAYMRKYRFTTDLSAGWGSNSQWRTEFRRDYTDGRKIYYNVDGTWDIVHETTRLQGLADKTIAIMKEEMSPEKRIEICRNRCAITHPVTGVDHFIWNDYYEEICP